MSYIVNFAFLLLRVMVGLTIAAHGAQKLFGWFGGNGLNKSIVSFENMGFKPVLLWLAFAIGGELVGGLFLASGFLTPVGAAGVFGAMSMATFKSHWKKGFFAQKGGYEYPLTIMVISLFFGLAGPGAYSFDALLGLDNPQPYLFIGLAAVAAVVVWIGILISKPHGSSV